MDQITLRVQPNTKTALEEEASENEETLSEYVRMLIAQRTEDTVPRDEYDRLQADYENLQSEHERVRSDVERLQSEKQAILAQREENTQLKTYVEEEQTWRQASLRKRAKWWVFGKN